MKLHVARPDREVTSDEQARSERIEGGVDGRHKSEVYALASQSAVKEQQPGQERERSDGDDGVDDVEGPVCGLIGGLAFKDA